MKPAYYFKTVRVKGETRYKMVGNYGVFQSYLLGKEFTWADLNDFNSYGVNRLVVDAEFDYEANVSNYVREKLGVVDQLFLAPGFHMTRDTQEIKVADKPITSVPAKPVARQIPCATDCGCGPTFTEYTHGVESVKADAIHTVPKKSFWAIVFGE